jgi:hypothetical protein
MSVTNPVTASFTAPATFEDGTAIPVGTITKYQYGFGQVSGTYTLVVDDADLTVTAGKQTGALPSNLAIGNWFAAARAVTKDGAVAKWGNEFAFAIAAKVPGPVSDFMLA